MNSPINSLAARLRGTWPQAAPPGLWPSLRRRALKHRRTIAVAGSAALHLLIVLALLWPRTQGLDGGGGGGHTSGAGTGDAFAAIDLDLIAKATIAPNVKTSDDLTRDVLDMPLDVDKPQTEALKTPDAVAQLTPADAGAGGAGQAGTTSGAGMGDDLWGAIAPCWKRVAGTDTLPVTLHITFAGNGGLSKPPVIVRASDAAITPQSLRSEAQALSALAACGAYPMAAGRQDVEIHFPKPG